MPKIYLSTYIALGQAYLAKGAFSNVKKITSFDRPLAYTQITTVHDFMI